MSSSEVPPGIDPAPRRTAAATPSGPAAARSASAPAEPAATTPAGVARWVATLDRAAALPLAEHVELYQRLHIDLQAALVEIDGA